MKEIKFEIKDESFVLTWCPYVRTMKVGSLLCQRCEHFDSLDHERNIVSCKFE